MSIDPRRWPFIGKEIGHVGKIYEIIASPCEPEPWIAVKAAFAYIPMLVWSINKPDPVDYLTERFGSTHKRKRKRRFPGDEIDIKPPRGGKGHLRWVTFRGVRMLERVGWYFTVIDATLDFAVNWASLAYMYSGCETPGQGFASIARREPYQVQNFLPYHTPSGDEWRDHGSWLAGPTVLVKDHLGPHMIGANVVFGRPTIEPHASVTNVELVAIQGGIESTIPLDITSEGSDGSREASIHNRDYNVFHPKTSFSVRVWHTPGYLKIDNFYMNGVGYPFHGVQHDP